MPQVSRTIVIDRPVKEVFAFLADAENDPQWRTGIKEINRIGELTVGARYIQKISGPAGTTIPADIELTAYEPNTKVAFRAIAGPVRPRGAYVFRSLADATEVTFTLEAELTGIKKLFMAGMVQKTMDLEAAALDRAKTLLESRA